MCEICTYSEIQVNAFDPTRTTTLRRAFVADVNRRFRALTAIVFKAVVTDDCFGLQLTAYLDSPGYKAFDFPRSTDKVEGFMRWFTQQVDRGILQTSQFSRIGTGVESAWTNIYIADTYKRGVMRAQAELNKAGYNIPSMSARGGIDAVMGLPFHVDRVGLLYSRTFSELKGITAVMDSQISRILAQGIADGDNPNLLARKLVATINGSGAGDLAITDSLGRFMPAQRRAQTMARTEIIRAHHQANMQEYKNWRVQGFKVEAEFVTAGDDRVCEECAGYHGNVYDLKVAENLVPIHPNCRCIVIPAEKNTVEQDVAQVQIPEQATAFKPYEVKNSVDLVERSTMSEFNTSMEGTSLSRANLVNRALADDIFGTLDDFASSVDKSNMPRIHIKVLDTDMPNHPSSVTGLFRPREVYMGTDMPVIRLSGRASTQSEFLNMGNLFGIGSSDVATVFRHEYGHFIMSKPNLFNVDSKVFTEWRTFFDTHPGYFKNTVSQYASTSADEAFAECFSAYTSPLYGVKAHNVLPREIEDLMIKLVGKRKDML